MQQPQHVRSDFIALTPYLVLLLQFLNISWSVGANDRLQVAPEEKV
jgi:hypothetical protein